MLFFARHGNKTIAPLSDSSTIALEDPMEKRTLRLLLAGAAGIGVPVVVSWLLAGWDVERRKRALTRHVEDERAVLSERSRAIVSAMDDVILTTAAMPYPGDVSMPSPEARAALFARPLVYVRAALPEV